MATPNNSQYGHFSRSACRGDFHMNLDEVDNISSKYLKQYKY